MPMQCAKHHKMKCYDSRTYSDRTRRNYRCEQCGERITTMEVRVERGTAAHWQRRKRLESFGQRVGELKGTLDHLLEDFKAIID